MSFVKENEISHLFANAQYEIDELRIFTSVSKRCSENSVSFEVCHDTCVVKPGALATKSKGTQFAVFTPWYKAWSAYVNQNFFSKKNFQYESLQKLDLNSSKYLEEETDFPDIEVDKKRFDKYWKRVGEDDAMEALREFINGDVIGDYGETRDLLTGKTTSLLSCHISSGTLSVRTILQELKNSGKLEQADEAETPGIKEWVRQLSWRDFYKHILCYWPHICMFKPFHLEYSDMEWEYDMKHFRSWCEGKTGFPIVDACMRSLNETGYMHNRGRLIVGSFLSKDLLIDWRYGEEYFMKNLIDGDFASNNGGWGFSASTGVDPQPYFRIFNPFSQSERFDKDGEFIRQWVPELKGITGKAIHNPYDSDQAAKAKKSGYPEPIVNHKQCRERALDVFKTTMQDGKAHIKEEVDLGE